MKNYLSNLFTSKGVVSEKSLLALQDSNEKLKVISEKLEHLSESFREGGIIDFDQLNTYTISTPENPIRYPTGKYCFAHRLPHKNPNKIMFYCIFDPPKGESAEYGWHCHPDCEEEVIQLSGQGISNDKHVNPFTVTKYSANQFHNYAMKDKGHILVIFTKV